MMWMIVVIMAQRKQVIQALISFLVLHCRSLPLILAEWIWLSDSHTDKGGGEKEEREK